MLFLKKDMREQYAEFCARGKPIDWDRRYKRALLDYDVLCAVPGVRCVGITRGKQRLLVGTECIDVHDAHGRLREIGEFIITISQRPPAFSVQNITRTVGECHHPHVNESGVMCTSMSRMELQCAIVDGQCSRVVAVLLPALRMDRQYVSIGTPYQKATISEWPLKQKGSSP